MKPITIEFAKERMQSAYKRGKLLAQMKVEPSPYFYRSGNHKGIACAVGACLPPRRSMPDRFNNPYGLDSYDLKYFASTEAFKFAVKAQTLHDEWSSSQLDEYKAKFLKHIGL